MGYIQDNLMPKEKVLFNAQIHPAVFLPSIFLLILLIVSTSLLLIFTWQQDTIAYSVAVPFCCISAFLFVTTIGFGIQSFIIMSTTEFVITNQRIITKTGFVRRRTLEMLLSKVESVRVNQSIMGRILNFGSITVIGTGGTNERFWAISEPVKVRRRIIHILEHYLIQNKEAI